MNTNSISRPQSRTADQALLLFLLLIVVMCLALLSGCSTLRVSSETDHNASFGQYRTFAWLPPDQKDWQTNISARNQANLIQNTVDKELAMRGMTADTAAPDVLLRYHIGAQNQATYHNQPVYSYAPPQPIFWGRGVWYAGGGYYPVYNRTYRSIVREGTLSVDVIDRRTNNVVWRGLSAERVDHYTGLGTEIPKIIQAIFERYPVRPMLSAK